MPHGKLQLNGKASHEECGFEEVRKEVIHFPSLRTVLMVEKEIEEKGEFKNKRQLWLSLKKGVMYQTLLMILDYLEASHKILMDRDGSIVWIWNPGLIEKVLKSGTRPL
jgi:hypothetical protein